MIFQQKVVLFKKSSLKLTFQFKISKKNKPKQTQTCRWKADFKWGFRNVGEKLVRGNLTK